ncbi:MAG: RHS repeat-associated core domain-containing protein [Polyangiaceae bacterium]
MARTAPVPNMVAIPGMNPGLFVMGGGGDGGGSGAGNGKGKGGKQGGDGKNGGNDANGGGKGANACGAGSSSCPGPHGGGGASAGHPVDCATGNVFTNLAVDLFLPGPFQLYLNRQYNSASCDMDIGLGWGWWHSFAYRIEVRQRTLTIWKGSGDAIIAPIPAVGDTVPLNDGWLLARTEEGYQLVDGVGVTRLFHEQNRLEDVYLLTAVVDRNDNDISFAYDGELLVMIFDSVGRAVRVRRHRDGHIAAFEVKNAPSQGRWISYYTYEYDDAGNLVSVVDAEGNTTAFQYDEEHRMTEEQRPGGLRAVFVWNEQGRCVESWCDHRGGPDASLADDLPELLADGVTKAKGLLHVKLEYSPDGYTEVVEARRVRRIFTNGMGKVEKATQGDAVFSHTYDARGFETSYTDPEGATWRFTRDAEGRLLSRTDPLGATTTFEYDSDGNVVEKTLPNGVTLRMQYDSNGNMTMASDPLGPIIQFAYNDRGQCEKITYPNGGVSTSKYDAHGNRVEIVEPDGATKRIAYDYLGRPTALVDARGGQTRYHYTARNLLRRMELPNGGAIQWEHDADGRVSCVIDPDGRPEQYQWAGNDVVVSVGFAGGPTVRAAYDRDGQMVAVYNEKGEVHRIERSSAGLVVAEHTFDGRTVRYKNDLTGRIIAIENDAGDKTELAYDPNGKLIERKFADDVVYKYVYDAAGYLIEAVSPDARNLFEYDARGHRTKEITVTGGEQFVVESKFDPMNRRTHKHTSLGYEEQIFTDVRARPVRVVLDGKDAIESRFDPGGYEVARRLPGGAVLHQAFDAVGMLERKSVVVGGAPDVPGAPPSPPVTTVEKVYRYSLATELIEEWDRSRGSLKYQLDSIGQVVARIPPSGLPEMFTYDEMRNGHESTPGAPGRDYGKGGICTRVGSTEYVYDAESRLVEKRAPRADGSGDEVWQYAWSAGGKLTSVTSPDGTVVELGYDAFDRRVAKRVTKAGQRKPSSQTIFVWDQLRLAHEIKKRASEAGDPIVEERTYVFSHASSEPVAHRDTVLQDGARVHGDWVFYVANMAHAPEHLINGKGDVLASMSMSIFGKTEVSAGARASTPLRFEGQYADEETGLSYNYSRYYDPELGRYISPDPILIEGSITLFAYVGNRPTMFTDPTGLAPVTCTMGTTGGTVTGHSQGYHSQNGTTAATNGGGSLPSNFPQLGGHWQGPNQCAEHDMLNQHFAGLDPDNPAHHDEIRRRAQQIQGPITPTRDGTNPPQVVPPCSYCTQRMARLSDVSGVNLFNMVTPPTNGGPPFTNMPAGGSRDTATRNAMGSGSPFPYTVTQPGNVITRSDGSVVNAT